MMAEKKTIIYFEDEPELLSAHLEALREKYEVVVSASQDLIEQARPRPVDLIIVDLMIHLQGFNATGTQVENIHYQGVKWQKTGVEFLRRLRAGDYQALGLPAATPVIAATAMVDESTRREVERLGVNAYLEKPFSMDQLEAAVDAILSR